MKFGTGSNNEITQKYEKVKVQNDIRTSKQTSPIFNCVTPVSVSLATLARQLYTTLYHAGKKLHAYIHVTHTYPTIQTL